jgi:hypothetical protein
MAALPYQPKNRVDDGRNEAMKIISAVALAAAVALPPATAGADDRALNTGLGVAAGAIVGGPIGAVAGGAIGYTAGKDISRAMGMEPRRAKRSRKAKRSRSVLHGQNGAR